MKEAPALAAMFDGAKPVAIDSGDGTLTVGFPANHTFNKRKVESADKREPVAKAIEAVVGQRLRPAYVVLDGEERPASGPSSEDAVDHDELVAKLKSEFDAEEVG